MSPSTQKWNPQRLYQWTENESNRMHRRESSTTRQTRHTDWLTNNRDQRQDTLPSETVPNKERATQDTSLHIRGRPLTPTKYHSEPRSSGSQVQLYISRTYHYIVYQDQTEAFHQDHPSGPRSNLQTDADLGDHPPTPIENRQATRKKSKKKTDGALVSKQVN